MSASRDFFAPVTNIFGSVLWLGILKFAYTDSVYVEIDFIFIGRLGDFENWVYRSPWLWIDAEPIKFFCSFPGNYRELDV